jgi:hypothetical protein
MTEISILFSQFISSELPEPNQRKLRDGEYSTKGLCVLWIKCITLVLDLTGGM